MPKLSRPRDPRHSGQLSIRSRLIAGFGTLVVLACAQGVAGLYYLGQINQRVEDIYTQELVVLERLDDAKSAAYRIRGDTLEHIMARSPASEERLAGEIDEQRRRLGERIQQYRTTRLSPEEERLVNEFESRFATYFARVEQEILPLSARDQKADAEALARGPAVEEFRDAREAMNALMDYSLRRAEQRYQNAVADYNIAFLTVSSVICVVSVLGAAISFYLVRAITRPLDRVAAHLAQIARGELSDTVETGGPAEFGPVVAALRDAQARAAAHLAEIRFQAESLDQAVAAIVATDLDGKVTHWNRHAETLYGLPRAEALGRQISDLGVRPQESTLAEVITEGAGARTRWEGELAFQHRDGAVIPLHATAAPILNSRGAPVGLVRVAVDITERKAMEARLEHQATHDPLTGLPNRTMFAYRLQHALAQGRSQDIVAVLFLDLDDFKIVNDGLGHAAGDALLVMVGERLRGAVRPGDLVARLGGDEFTVLLEGLASPDEAIAHAQRLVEELTAPFALPGREVMVTVSIGIAVAGDGGSGDLLRRADIAMYEAKRDGKARWALFGGDAETRAAERLLLEGELRRALAEGQLRVVYQPIIDLATDRINEVEALVRWEHPRRGLLPAGEFVPLAEETGLIVPLGKWVLAEACGQARAWQDGRPLSERIAVAVNFSARHFREPGLVDSVASLLSQIGLDPGCLKVEITERVALDDAEETTAALRGLKALGVGLVVDDFGTGYSGLSSLKRTPIDTVKIDQSIPSRSTRCLWRGWVTATTTRRSCTRSSRSPWLSD